MLVYDVAGTYEDNGVTYWLGEIDNYSQHSNIILIGNKTDLLSKKSKSNQLNEESDEENSKKKKPPLLPAELKAIDRSKWAHLTISCLENDNLDVLWQAIISKSRESMGYEKPKSVVLSSNIKNGNNSKLVNKNKRNS